MELGLSLGEAPKPFGFLEKPREQVINNNNKGTGFCMALSIGPSSSSGGENDQNEADHEQQRVIQKQQQQQRGGDDDADVENDQSASTAPPVQLDLLPRTPVLRTHGFPWISSENGETFYQKYHPEEPSLCFL